MNTVLPAGFRELREMGEVNGKPSYKLFNEIAAVGNVIFENRTERWIYFNYSSPYDTRKSDWSSTNYATAQEAIDALADYSRQSSTDVTRAGISKQTAADVIEKLKLIRNDYGIDYDEFMALVSKLFNN